MVKCHFVNELEFRSIRCGKPKYALSSLASISNEPIHAFAVRFTERYRDLPTRAFSLARANNNPRLHVLRSRPRVTDHFYRATLRQEANPPLTCQLARSRVGNVSRGKRETSSRSVCHLRSHPRRNRKPNKRNERGRTGREHAGRKQTDREGRVAEDRVRRGWEGGRSFHEELEPSWHALPIATRHEISVYVKEGVKILNPRASSASGSQLIMEFAPATLHPPLPISHPPVVGPSNSHLTSYEAGLPIDLGLHSQLCECKISANGISLVVLTYYPSLWLLCDFLLEKKKIDPSIDRTVRGQRSVRSYLKSETERYWLES